MSDQSNDADNELEELVLRESIVSATGLNETSVEIGIKGDPSLRRQHLSVKNMKVLLIRSCQR